MGAGLLERSMAVNRRRINTYRGEEWKGKYGLESQDELSRRWICRFLKAVDSLWFCQTGFRSWIG